MSNPFEDVVNALKLDYEQAPRPKEFSIFTGVSAEQKDIETLYKDIPCQAACPAKTNVPAYIQAIAEGDPEQAYRINLEDNVFPGALGRICTRPCEDQCRHKWTNVNGPVHICHLKRASGDHSTEAPTPLPAWFDASGKRIAVVGGGPAGLTAARELKRYGHDVVVFERETYLGGMMTMGIPKFRLPRDVVDQETKVIVDSGITVEYGVDVDAEKMAELADTFDAVLVATGAMHPSDLSLPGLDGESEVAGLEFMRRYNFGEIGDMKGQSIVIVGGGFTAVDCARSCARAARRLVGAEGNVSIMYRRTEGQMSANMDEIEAMRDENIVIDTLVSPVSVRVEDGKLKGVTFRRNMLGDVQPGHSKPPITPIENSDFEVSANLMIVAIGQVRQFEILPENLRATEGHNTTLENVFVAGDFKDGGEDVITAVNDAKKAADLIDLYLTGTQRRKTHVAIDLVSTNGETGRLRDHDIQQGAHMPHLPITERDGLAEVEQGFNEAVTGVHATRCYLCHYKFEINQDKCIHCDWCIKVAPRKDCIKKISRLFKDEHDNVKTELETSRSHEATYIWIDSDECIRCGACMRRCPTEAITLRKISLNTTTISEFDLLKKSNVVEEPAVVDLG
ncbi:MAG: FAD-dependent oxidoreductase [Kiritimatiellae bacterium]|nr:FAD-dependent oxidoreductase [Kiritimatiellia bacterium]